MAKIGLVVSITKSVYSIDLGRKNLAIEGTEGKGRVMLSTGLLTALAVFKEVWTNATNDLETLILVELAYLIEERQYCTSAEPEVLASLNRAIESFNNALRALKTVQDAAAYKNAETTYPTLPQYRYHGMPKDALHIACIANRIRINNTLRTPGINATERQVYEQRSKNMTAAQVAYLGMQEAALAA
ncbi:hypothetical protein AGMMS49965_18990 [Bacteroidia bacterium]|nr:hypothetical protein AGMMS49965_18990 [Bacteroidia bacterium]